MFRSIFMEGFARPWAGVRLILKNLVRKFKQLGGELRLRAGVERIEVEDGRVTRVVLTTAPSSKATACFRRPAGSKRCGCATARSPSRRREAGQLSFVETVSVLDAQPRELGCDRTIVFFNDSETFHWHKPDELVDVRSGVICSPNNFAYEPAAGRRHDAHHGAGEFRPLAEPVAPRNTRLPSSTWYDRIVDVGGALRAPISAPAWSPPTCSRPPRSAASPATRTAPSTARRKSDSSGTTHLKNLFICGTDQGFVGIIGTMISGIAMANRHLLRTAVGDPDEEEVAAALHDLDLPGSSMPKDFLQGAREHYDCIVIGSGLAGLTAANTLARAGQSVLLLEQHYKLGGMATWFKRPRRAHLRYLAARLSGRHDQELPPLLDAAKSPTRSCS